MTVWEHFLVAQPHSGSRFAAVADTPLGSPQALRACAARCWNSLTLGDFRDRIARSLPYGIQRKVEMARAVTARPKLLLLDEPVAGMNHDEAEHHPEADAEAAGHGLSIF